METPKTSASNSKKQAKGSKKNGQVQDSSNQSEVKKGSSEFYYLRVKNIERTAVIKRLLELKAKHLSSGLNLQVRFKLDPNAKLSDKFGAELKGSRWLSINSSEGSSTMVFEENDLDGLNMERSELKIDDFFKAAKMLISAIPKTEYDYIELNKDIYWLDESTIIIEEMPLQCALIISSLSRQKAEEIYKKLKIKGLIEPNFNMSTAERYYRIHGFDYEIVKTVFKRRLHKKLGLR